MVDFAQARRMMVDNQLRTFDVNDPQLLDAMDAIPREDFVPAGRRALAYIDQNIAVLDGAERRMLSPMILARLIQALELVSGAKVLDVASGTGYSSLIMAKLGATVMALESDKGLSIAAHAKLAESGAGAVTTVTGPLFEGWAAHAPYDAVLVNGAVEMRPEGLLMQLAEGGRLICVCGRGRSARATLFVRSGDAFGQRDLFDAAVPLLHEFRTEPQFTF